MVSEPRHIDDGVPRIPGLRQEAAHTLVAAGERRRLVRGEVIFAMGDPGDFLLVIMDGKVRVGRPGDGGKENLLTLLGPGDLLGELTMFDPSPRQATARAVTEVEVVSITAGAMRSWLASEPEAAWQLIRLLTLRLRRTNDIVENLLFPDVPRRVARAVLELADRFGRRVPDGVRVHHDLTQDELAHYVGASRERVNRVLAELADRGVLRLESRSLVITDPDRLRRKAAADHEPGAGKPA